MSVPTTVLAQEGRAIRFLVVLALLILLVVLVVWAARLLLQRLKVPEPAQTILLVVLALVLLLVLLTMFGVV